MVAMNAAKSAYPEGSIHSESQNAAIHAVRSRGTRRFMNGGQK